MCTACSVYFYFDDDRHRKVAINQLTVLTEIQAKRVSKESTSQGPGSWVTDREEKRGGGVQEEEQKKQEEEE